MEKSEQDSGRDNGGTIKGRGMGFRRVRVSERSSARRKIDFFLAHHQLGSYRRCSREEFAEQAQGLLACLRLVERGDIARMINSLHRIADEVAQMELDDLLSDGYRERAAEEIIRAAADLNRSSCPWSDLRHLLSKTPIRGRLADVLWASNKRMSDEWEVSLDVLSRDVWGDECTPQGRIRGAVSRLLEWLVEHGVDLELSVNGSVERPHVACRIVSVNAAKVRAASAGEFFLPQQSW